MTPETVSIIAAALHTRPFEMASGSPTQRAQSALDGLTYYVTRNTLRFHHSRIIGARPVLGGAFFLILETVAKDYENTQRGTRAVLFDLLGNTVYHPKLEDTRRTRERALRDYEAWLGAFDPVEHYRSEIQRKAASMAAEVDGMLAGVEKLAA
jgi:hypothetical protein